MSTRIDICPNCLRSVVTEDTELRLAIADDTTVLTPEQLAILRARRKALREARAKLVVPTIEPIVNGAV
jgi:hypothetical protein